MRDVALVELAGFDGVARWQEQVAVDAAANCSICVWRGATASTVDCVLTVRSANDAFPANRLLLCAVKDLKLDPDPGLEVIFTPQHITISAQRYALAIRLRSDNPAVRYDDNHFDLKGGERRTVVVTGASSPADIEINCWNGRLD